MMNKLYKYWRFAAIFGFVLSCSFDKCDYDALKEDYVFLSEPLKFMPVDIRNFLSEECYFFDDHYTSMVSIYYDKDKKENMIYNENCDTVFSGQIQWDGKYFFFNQDTEDGEYLAYAVKIGDAKIQGWESGIAFLLALNDSIQSGVNFGKINTDANGHRTIKPNMYKLYPLFEKVLANTPEWGFLPMRREDEINYGPTCRPR